MIVGLSTTRTVEEKIGALQYLVEHYDEDSFEKESANMEPRTYGHESMMLSRGLVIETIRVWENVLQNRYRKDGIYAAKPVEKKTEIYGQIKCLESELDGNGCWYHFLYFDEVDGVSRVSVSLTNAEIDLTSGYSSLDWIERA